MPRYIPKRKKSICPHKNYTCKTLLGASQVAQLVENPPVMQETLIQFLGQEDQLEKG